jgi:hypothetical protein
VAAAVIGETRSSPDGGQQKNRFGSRSNRIGGNLVLETQESVEQLSINTIRTLSMDAVQAANSGHPGTPMALAPVV